MDERIKKQRLSRLDFSNFPSIISRVIREIKYVFRILKRTKKYSVFFYFERSARFSTHSIRVSIKIQRLYRNRGGMMSRLLRERGGGNGYGEKAWRSWKASVERRVFMVSTEITREELFRRNIFARTIKVFGWGGAIGPRNRIEIRRSRPFVNFFISSFHYFIGVVPRYHIFVDRGETNGRTIMRPWNWSTRRVCARAQNLIALTSEQRAIWPILYIYTMSVCVRTCTPHNFDYTCNPVVLIHKFHIRERNDVNTRSNDRFVNPPSFIGSSTRYFFFVSFSLFGGGSMIFIDSFRVDGWAAESERKRFIGEFQRYQQCE